jgi:hypothetical protein
MGKGNRIHTTVMSIQIAASQQNLVCFDTQVLNFVNQIQYKVICFLFLSFQTNHLLLEGESAFKNFF